MRAVEQQPVGVFRGHPAHVRALAADVDRNVGALGLVVESGARGVEGALVVDALAGPELLGGLERL